MANYSIERNGPQCNVKVQGDFEVSLIAELQPKVRGELENETREVVFDFGQTTLLDSSGIGLLIATGNSLAKHNGKIRVINVSPDIMRLLTSMRLAPRLNATGR